MQHDDELTGCEVDVPRRGCVGSATRETTTIRIPTANVYPGVETGRSEQNHFHAKFFAPATHRMTTTVHTIMVQATGS